MPGSLSEKDSKLILELREAGVFQDVDQHLIDQSNGIILVTCSDADRFPEIFSHQVRMQADCRADPRIHTLAWNGGALACAPNSPINKRRGDEQIFLDQVAGARELKSINQVVLGAHWLCGMAAYFHLSLEEVLALQMSAKSEIKRLNRGIQVACFFPIDYGKKQRTYFLSRPHWEEWAGKSGIPAFAGC